MEYIDPNQMNLPYGPTSDFSFDVDAARIILGIAARDIDDHLAELRDCTRIGRDILGLEVTV